MPFICEILHFIEIHFTRIVRFFTFSVCLCSSAPFMNIAADVRKLRCYCVACSPISISMNAISTYRKKCREYFGAIIACKKIIGNQDFGSKTG